MTAAFFAVFKHNGQNQFALDKESHRTIITAFILLCFLTIYKLQQAANGFLFSRIHCLYNRIGVWVVETDSKAVAPFEFFA